MSIEITNDGIGVTASDGHAWRVAQQALELGIGEETGGVASIPWDGIYALLAVDPSSGAALGLPAVDPDLVPSLTDNGTTLGDNFRVTIDGWCNARDGRRITDGVPRPVGPVVQLTAGDRRMLSETAWRVVEGVRAYALSRQSGSSTTAARRAWSAIGRDARACNAPMTHTLRTTIVVGVDHLDLKVSRTGANGVFEIRPSFDGAPDGWLGIYDRRIDVPEMYRVSGSGSGIDYEVLLDDDVRAVLSEVKRELPHRRVAGVRAQRMIRNPFAYFGDRSGVLRDDVVDAQIEELERGAHRFEVTADLLATPIRAGVAVDAADTESEDELILWDSPGQAEAFARIIDRALAQGASIVRWRQRDLLLDIDHSAAQASLARKVAARWAAIELPSSEPPASETSVDSVLDEPTENTDDTDEGHEAEPVATDSAHEDLTNVSRRIEGFGIEHEYAIIRVPSREGWPGWLPEQFQDALEGFDGGDSGATSSDSAGGGQLKISADDIQALRQATEDDGSGDIQLPDCGISITRDEAKQLLAALEDPESTNDVADSTSLSDAGGAHVTLSLIATPNIDTVEYVTHRDDLTLPTGATASRPSMLDDWVELRPHQNECLAWLQHLWSLGAEACNGALLADDMGLGKTLQALAFIAGTREDAERAGIDLPPALVIAPVTLLENWQAEIRRFFGEDNLIAAPTHGSVARSLRAATFEIPEDLVEKGITQIFRPGWTRKADVVLSTYETVRDYEYSFATQPWSVVVVDEAQAIKNPNAARTRAIVKLNARFCLACTGTPVETSLTDLWSIFNFVQPSLLGSANDFGRRFKKAIADGGEERESRIAELRALIEPQKLRRMKSEIAGDLPPKLFDESCHAIPMTDAQEAAYLDAARGGASGGSAGMLQTIHQLRRICSDFSMSSDPIEREEQPLAEARRESAKLDWLMRTLAGIQARGEKVLVFAEHLDVQRRLKRFIDEQFGIDLAIINGSTSTAAKSERSRQNLINAFSDPERDGVFDVMVLSPIAAGVGLNIQAANHVIHFQRHWNPAKEDQATDRAYRIGQRRPVTVYTPIVVGSDFTSFDVRLDQLLAERRNLASDMLAPIREVDPMEFASLFEAATPAASV